MLCSLELSFCFLIISALLTVLMFTVVLFPQIEALLTCLWSTLRDLDDLTSSTCSVMSLLAAIVRSHVTTGQSSRDVATDQQSSRDVTAGQQSSRDVMVQQLPQLLPFLHHTMPSVRRAALETLAVLLDQYAHHGQVTANTVGV